MKLDIALAYVPLSECSVATNENPLNIRQLLTKSGNPLQPIQSIGTPVLKAKVHM